MYVVDYVRLGVFSVLLPPAPGKRRPEGSTKEQREAQRLSTRSEGMTMGADLK